MDDLAADRQPQAGALRLLRQRVADLAEFLEDHALVVSTDADAVVRDLHAQAFRQQGAGHFDAAAAVAAELGRVGQQVQHHLHQAIAVRVDGRQVGRQLEVDRDVLVGEELTR